MKNGPATDHFGFCFEMGLAGLLPLGTDHFGFGFEMGLSGGRGVPLSASSWKEERTCYGPFWLRLRNGLSRADDRQERGSSQNGVVDRRHDSSRSPFPRRKRNGNSRRNPSRIDEEGIRSWLQVGARTLGRGIGGIQR